MYCYHATLFNNVPQNLPAVLFSKVQAERLYMCPMLVVLMVNWHDVKTLGCNCCRQNSASRTKLNEKWSLVLFPNFEIGLDLVPLVDVMVTALTAARKTGKLLCIVTLNCITFEGRFGFLKLIATIHCIVASHTSVFLA